MSGTQGEAASSRGGNRRGAWALGLGIASIVTVLVPYLYLLTSLVGGIVAIVLGVQGRRLAARGLATNRSQATGGVVLGSIGLALGLAGFLLGALAASVVSR